MTAPVFDLPVADKPGWELKNESEELKSIPDRSLHSHAYECLITRAQLHNLAVSSPV